MKAVRARRVCEPNEPRIDETWGGLFELVREGKIRPLIGARYPMERVAEAMNRLISRQAVGKIILHW